MKTKIKLFKLLEDELGILDSYFNRLWDRRYVAPVPNGKYDEHDSIYDEYQRSSIRVELLLDILKGE